MAKPLAIRIGSTETLYDYPPILGDGALAAATVRVRTPSTALPSSGDTASYSAVDTTLAAAASAGATALTLTDGTGVGEQPRTNRFFISLSPDGYWPFAVEVLKASGENITLREPLPMDVPNGTKFYGVSVSHALTAAETSIAGEGLAIWTVTGSNSQVRTWRQQFSVVKYLPRPTLGASGLTAAFPIVHRLQAPTDTDLGEAIQGAWDNLLLPDLEGRGLDVERVISWERMEPVHACAVVLHLLYQDSAQDPGFVDMWERRYKDRLDVVLQGKHHWYDQDNESVVRDEGAGPGLGTFLGYGR